MQVYLVTKDGDRLPCDVPYAGATYVVAPGTCACGGSPWKVQGGTPRASDDQAAWEATAVAACCRTVVGTLRAESATLFGVTEDQRVLAGPWRVF